MLKLAIKCVRAVLAFLVQRQAQRLHNAATKNVARASQLEDAAIGKVLQLNAVRLRADTEREYAANALAAAKVELLDCEAECDNLEAYACLVRNTGAQ